MNGKSYHVVNQHQSTQLTPAGTFEDVMEVTAVSDETGASRTIRVPLPAYTVENVEHLLDTAFDETHAVHALGN